MDNYHQPSLTFANVLSLHVFQCSCAPSGNEHGVALPALVFLLTGLAPHHTEVPHAILATARVWRDACRPNQGRRSSSWITDYSWYRSTQKEDTFIQATQSTKRGHYYTKSIQYMELQSKDSSLPSH